MAAPEPAKTPSFEMLSKFESLVFTAPTEPLQINAGFDALLGWSIVRAHDAQHTSALTLTKESVLGVSYDSKNSQTSTTYAALRYGVSQQDWGGKFLELLGKHSMPGGDYLLRAPSSNYLTFTDRIARFSDLQSAMRVLMQVLGMSPEQALEYSLHSRTHLIPTASRQLGHRQVVNTMQRRAHLWSSTQFGELMLKHDIWTCYQQGWNLVGDGEIPMTRPATTKRAKVQQPKPDEFKMPPLKNDRLKATADSIPHVIQVVNTTRRRAHLWFEAKGTKSVCGYFNCGTSKEPRPSADFKEPAGAVWEPNKDLALFRSCNKWLEDAVGLQPHAIKSTPELKAAEDFQPTLEVVDRVRSDSEPSVLSDGSK